MIDGVIPGDANRARSIRKGENTEPFKWGNQQKLSLAARLQHRWAQTALRANFLLVLARSQEAAGSGSASPSSVRVGHMMSVAPPCRAARNLTVNKFTLQLKSHKGTIALLPYCWPWSRWPHLDTPRCLWRRWPGARSGNCRRRAAGRTPHSLACPRPPRGIHSWTRAAGTARKTWGQAHTCAHKTHRDKWHLFQWTAERNISSSHYCPVWMERIFHPLILCMQNLMGTNKKWLNHVI